MTEQYIYGQPVYGQNMQYQTGIQTNPVIVQGANYGYTQQVYLQPQQAGQVYNYQQGGYYQQPIQVNQQQFQQDQQAYQQYPTQQSTVSRNPNIQSQFQTHQQSQKVVMDKPLIESQFQPSIPIANSVIDQSQITFEKKASQASVGSGNNDNFMASQISHDEFPIHESIPLTNNNLNFDNQQVSQNPFGPSTSGDIDVNMSHLPTINSIMKGTKEILPPPKKNKYQ